MIALVDALVDWIDVTTATLTYSQEIPYEYKKALVERLAVIKEEVKKWKASNE